MSNNIRNNKCALARLIGRGKENRFAGHRQAQFSPRLLTLLVIENSWVYTIPYVVDVGISE